jgi:hypothetical protein
MSTELKILDTEKQMLLQNLVTARAEVDRARIGPVSVSWPPNPPH